LKELVITKMKNKLIKCWNSGRLKFAFADGIMNHNIKAPKPIVKTRSNK
jgi:hypothetical protein